MALFTLAELRLASRKYSGLCCSGESRGHTEPRAVSHDGRCKQRPRGDWRRSSATPSPRDVPTPTPAHYPAAAPPSALQSIPKMPRVADSDLNHAPHFGNVTIILRSTNFHWEASGFFNSIYQSIFRNAMPCRSCFTSPSHPRLNVPSRRWKTLTLNIMYSVYDSVGFCCFFIYFQTFSRNYDYYVALYRGRQRVGKLFQCINNYYFLEGYPFMFLSTQDIITSIVTKTLFAFLFCGNIAI